MTEFTVTQFDQKIGGVVVDGGSRQYWFQNIAGADSVRKFPVLATTSRVLRPRGRRWVMPWKNSWQRTLRP